MDRQGNSDENENADQQLLLTTAEAATLAGVGERTWWRWSRCGLAPAPISIGIGTRPAVRYRRSDLLEWIADGCPRIEKGGGQ